MINFKKTLVAAALVAAVAGVTLIPAGANAASTVTLCVNKVSKKVTVKSWCHSTETKMVVNATGLRGLTGLRGYTGNDGAVGAAGAAGAFGPAGPSGGVPGVDGAAGAAGADGAAGLPGADGAVGAVGASAVDLVGTACTAGVNALVGATFKWVETASASGNWVIACTVTP